MRNIALGVGAAALAAVVLVFATPAAAAATKPCWDHWDEEAQQLVRVWANGGGHDSHVNDWYLTNTDSRTACEDYVAPV